MSDPEPLRGEAMLASLRAVLAELARIERPPTKDDTGKSAGPCRISMR